MVNIYFWRQFFILFTTTLYTASVGVMMAFPSALTPAIVSPNTTDIKATSDQASWMTAVNGISGMLGYFILSPILQIYGRKIVHIISNALVLIGWIIFVFAHNVEALFAARIIQGVALGGAYIHPMIISEYADPKRRGYFITYKKMWFGIGNFLCHALTLCWTWRQIALFTITLSSVSMVFTFFWPETPAFLAMTGRFEESEKSFLWLHGGSNMKELNFLLTSQKEKQEHPPAEKWYKSLFTKSFMKPIVIVSIITLATDLCGKYFLGAYIIQIMVELTGDKSVAIYCSTGSDLLIILALLLSCFIIRKFKRRTILLTSGMTAVLLMFTISITAVLKLSVGAWLIPTLILLHSCIINVGFVSVGVTLIGEVFPLQYKGAGSCISGLLFTFLYAVTLKLTLILIENTGLEGVYGIYGISTAACLVVIYYVVPETKDKTLQEIEGEFKGTTLTPDMQTLG